ncbi:MAG: threonine--tRNA ligase [Candidatus Sungbacteria bacterium]|nr:threonine--tRNA ligase [Candidatus Sungbacteria bacterium]
MKKSQPLEKLGTGPTENQEQPKELPENDHRTLGQRLDLFSFHDISPGAPFWHPKGMLIFRELEKFARKINDQNGYQEISTPILVKKELFEKSGHWEYYKENIFWFQNPRDENEVLALKSMNCPESSFIYNSAIRSYKDFPLRLAEIGRLHRNELSGTLGGLLRVRQITMDDAHIFVRQDQAVEEIRSVLKTINDFYSSFGFKPKYVLATKPEKALGTKTDWDLAEQTLKDALEKSGLLYKIAEKEGAFYGPKIEVHIDDSQNRDWQLGTAQLDTLMLPKRLKLSYIDEDGSKQTPWVIHRAVFGSFERFIAILLEHFNGALPFWLSPIQVAILPINDKVTGYCSEIAAKLSKADIRFWLDDRNESIGKKIREAEMQKIPYLLVVGDREAAGNVVSIRERGKGDTGQKPLEKFLEMVYTEKIP